jgi:hypothetical protein
MTLVKFMYDTIYTGFDRKLLTLTRVGQFVMQ